MFSVAVENYAYYRYSLGRSMSVYGFNNTLIIQALRNFDNVSRIVISVRRIMLGDCLGSNG